MYAPTPQKGPQAPWAASADPRSVPTPPISNQPRKKSRVSTTPDCYYRTVTSPQDFDPKGIKEEPRARVPYDIDSIAGYPAGDAQDAFLGPPAEDYWYQARDDGRRTPAGWS